MVKNSGKLSVGFCYDDSLDKTDGVAQYVKNLGQWLSGQGHHVFYMVGETYLKRWSGGSVYSLSKNQKVFFNGNFVSTPLPASRRRIKQVLQKERPDILHVQVPYSPFMAGRIIRAAGPETTVVGTFHILPAGRLASFGSRLLRVAYLAGLRRFDLMLSVSLPASKFAKKFFGLDSQVIPNVVNLKRFNAGTRAGRGNRQSDVLFLGRLVPRKGCQQLLEAFLLLHERHPGLKLVVAGDGPERSDLEKFVARSGLKQAVTFLGYVSESDKVGWLAGAKIACFPSLGGESFGIVLIEAMAAGSGVVIGGNNPGYRSVLAQQPELLVNPLDRTAFARRLELLLIDHSLRRRLHQWQLNHVRQYDVAKVGPQVVDVYRQAIAKRRQKGHN